MRQYALITASYWAFTLTDGALRMLVVLHFHQLGYSPLDIALLFLFYELFGVVTNLLGGWLAARIGLTATLIGGLLLQIGALGMLLVDPAMLTVAWVMAAQALSGIAKDLNKMSAKSGVKLVVDDREGRLYRWVAALTGSKNALKGAGFFLGGAMLGAFGFQGAVLAMAAILAVVTLVAVFTLDRHLGKTTFKPKFTDLLSKSRRINLLSGARLFLFASRDVWFVVALPVYLQHALGWSNVSVGTLLAGWIIGYGMIQALAPGVTGMRNGRDPHGGTAAGWGWALVALPAAMAGALLAGIPAATVLIVGLIAYAAVFAVNSAVHSYLIVAFAERDGVTLDVGFYYMSNAAGRLLGTIASGWIYQSFGLETCLLVATLFTAISALIATALPRAAGP